MLFGILDVVWTQSDSRLHATLRTIDITSKL